MRDIIYNNVRLSDYIIIKDIKESLLPNITNTSLKFNMNVGLKFIRQEMGPRQFIINAEIIADTIQDREELINLLAPMFFIKEEKELILDNNRKYKAILDGSTNIDNIRYDGLFTLNFIAYNPIAYGDQIELSAANGDILVNLGNYETKPIIKFIAENTKTKIKLKNSNEYNYIEVNYVNVNDEIVIDMENEIVTVNGDIYINYIDPLGDFFPLPAGEFELEITGTSNVNLSFLERWI